VREELQAAMDQLPEGGSQEGEHHGGGGGDDHQAPRHAWQQVPTHIYLSGIRLHRLSPSTSAGWVMCRLHASFCLIPAFEQLYPRWAASEFRLLVLAQ